MNTVRSLRNFNKNCIKKILLVLIFIIMISPNISGLGIYHESERPQDLSLGAVEELEQPLKSEIESQQVQSSRYPYNYDDVLVIYNNNSALSRQIAFYFQTTRNIADINMCNISTSTGEVINRAEFENVRAQVENYLINNNLTNTTNYFVTTKGVPLKVSEQNTADDNWNIPSSIDRASFDQELSMIMGPYVDQIGIGGPFLNPLFEETQDHSREAQGMFLVTRLTGYEWGDIKRMIDNGNVSYGYHTGNFVLDVDPGKDGSPGYQVGNDWLRNANLILNTRGYTTLLDQTDTFVTDQTNVGGYGSWGSNDGHYSSNWALNNGLETDNSPADGIPDNWFVEFDPVNDNLSRNNTWSQQGTWSFNITRTEKNSNFSAISQNITIPANVRFYLAGFVNVSNVTNDKGAHLMIRAYDAGDNLLQIFNGTTRRRGTAANFQSLGQLRYEPVQNAVKITVSGVLSKSTGTALFDNIRLFEIKPHNTWVPGAIAETFVSTGGRSFKITTTYGQSLVADLIREGVSGVKGYVYEPYLTAIAHPDILFDRYTLGYNLAESYWYASQLYGWMGTVIGDPKIQPYHDLLADAEIVADDITFSNPIPNSDEDLEIFAKVWNLGNFSLNSLKVKFYLGDPSNDKLIGEKDIAALPILQSTTVNITWNIASNTQNQTIYVVVDPDGMIHEQNEKNNVASRVIYINIKPEIVNKAYSTLEINRTESVEIEIDAHDFESAEADLEVFGYCKIKEATEWVNISSSAVYNVTHWELTFIPEIHADLGRYTFKFHIIDENNCSSMIYFDHAILTVRNNLPEIVEIGILKNVTAPPTFLRTERIAAYVDCNDIEVIDTVNASNMELEIRYMAPSSGWQQIFDVINFSGLDNNAYRWEIRFAMDEDAELGVYSLSARIKDLDDEYSNWFYKNNSFLIQNNRPAVTNVSIAKTSVYRSESALITFQTTDIEDLDLNLDCSVEYQLLNYSDPGNLDEALWADDLIEGLDYDSFQIGWTANFVTSYDIEIGEYIFRVRALDKDGSSSGWLVAYNDTLMVNNNPPFADIGAVPSDVDEDEVIRFDARDSHDPEHGAYGLSYHWDFGDGSSSTTPKTDHAYTDQGTYRITLSVWDKDGALTEINTTITVLNVGPTATASVDKSSAYTNETLTFDTAGTFDTASDFANLSYRWEFGDGLVEQGADLNQTNHSYTASGIYYVYLTVFDDDGANDTFQLKVRINAIEDLDGDGIPDAIDPDIDGDGIPNEEDEFPYDGTKSQQEESGEEDLTSTYIVAGIILIVICFIIIWLLFARSTAKRKEKPPRPRAAAEGEMVPPDAPVTLEAAAAKLPIPPPPPPEESIQEPSVVPTTLYPPESPQLAPQPAVIGYLPAPSERPDEEMEE